MVPTPTLAVSNNLFTAKLPLFIDVTVPFIDITAYSIDVTAPFINITAPPINITATINYSRDLVTLVKMYTEESKYSKKDNNFDYKLIIFNNLCNKVSIP